VCVCEIECRRPLSIKPAHLFVIRTFLFIAVIVRDWDKPKHSAKESKIEIKRQLTMYGTAAL